MLESDIVDLTEEIVRVDSELSDSTELDKCETVEDSTELKLEISEDDSESSECETDKESEPEVNG